MTMIKHISPGLTVCSHDPKGLYVLIYFIVTTALWGSYSYFPHLMNWNTESYRYQAVSVFSWEMPGLGVKFRELASWVHLWCSCAFWSRVLCFSLSILGLNLRRQLCGYNHILSQALLAEIVMLERAGEKGGFWRLMENGSITQRVVTFFSAKVPASEK